MFASVAMAAGNIYTGNFIGNGTGLTNLNLGLNLIQPTNTAVAMTNGLANNLTLTGTTTGAVVNVTTVNATTLVVTNAGVGTTISSNSVTTGTFNGSGAGLTALNPTNLTGGVTLPALNAANLTNLPTAGLSLSITNTGNTNLATTWVKFKDVNGNPVWTIGITNQP